MNHCALKTEEVISHVLEIIYLMTGEEYMMVKKPPLYKSSPQVSEDIYETRKSVLEIPADSPVHVRKRSGCHSASQVACEIKEEAQKEFRDSTFQPHSSGAHVQIKCDDVAMYLSVEEWEYLEHHKEEYEVMTGGNQPSPDGLKDSEQRDCSSNDNMEETKNMDWNTENEATAPNVSSIRTRENNPSPKIDNSNQLYRQNNMTEGTCGPTQSSDAFGLQNNQTLNHEPLSEILLETEIKEEQSDFQCVMDDREDTAVKINNSYEADSPSLDSNQNLFSDVCYQTHRHNAWSLPECLPDGLQRKTINATDSSGASNYTVNFVPQPFSEDPRHTPIPEGPQTKIAEFTGSGLLDGHTFDHVQSPFEDLLQNKHIKKEPTKKRCSMAGQEDKTSEVSDFSLETSHTFTNLPQITHSSTEQQNEECSTDGHQSKKVDIKNCLLEKADTGTILNIFPIVYENAHIKGNTIYQVCFLDETKKVEINDFLMNDSDGLYQMSNSFSDGPQRTSIKNEPIHPEHSTKGHQRMTMDKKNSDLVKNHTLSCGTSTLQSHDKSKLTYQEHSVHSSQQTKTVEVNHSIPEIHGSLNTDQQTSNKPLTHLDFHYFSKEPVYHNQGSTWQSTGRVQSRSKPPKVISCSDCGKVFSCNSYLSRHQRLHTGEKPFTCSECGKSFSWMSSLVTHKRTHLGEKPFSCKQCGKRFADYSGIIKHRRSHTGEKPYTCLLCGERFAQTYQLVKHQAVHLAEDVPEKPSNS